MSDRNYIVNALEKLIEVSRDGQSAYREAAAYVKSPELRAFLEQVSLERAKFAGDLETEVTRLGKPDVDRSGSVKGTIRCGWIDLKGNLGGRDDEVVSSLETGDAGAKDVYEKYVNDNELPDEILRIIRNQASSLAGVLDSVREVCGRRKAA